MSKTSIDHVIARLVEAFARRDAAAAAGCYTLDGKLMAPFAEPFVGRAAIEGFIRAGFEQGVARLGLQTVTLEVLGQTALEEGLFTTWTADDEEIDHGKYLVIWREVDGHWLMSHDMMSSNRPPQEAKHATSRR